MPLIRDYIAEHERVTNHGGDAVRAIEQGDLELARQQVTAMAEELTTHWQGEENGLFEVMKTEEEYADYIAPLVAEHRELATFLAGIDVSVPDDQERLRVVMVALHEHVSREEDGLFPASLTALDGQDWNAAIEAWHVAHPDESMIV